MENQEKINKLTDKAFSRLVIMSIFAILVCVVCLCASTWAWFSESLPSNNNVITAASDCKISVSVEKDGTEIAIADIENAATLELEGGVSYTVKVTLPKDSSSGYLVISTDSAEYYAEYIEHHDSEQDKAVTFTLTSAETQNVTFSAKWGIYSEDAAVLNNGSLNIQ